MMKTTVQDINEFIRRARGNREISHDLRRSIASFLENWLDQKREAGQAGKGRPRRRPNIKAEADLSASGRRKRALKEKRGNENA